MFYIAIGCFVALKIIHETMNWIKPIGWQESFYPTKYLIKFDLKDFFH